MSTRTAGQGLTRARKGVAVGGSGPPLGQRKVRRPGANLWTLLAFAAPSLLLLLLINLYPVIYAGYQSLRNGSLIAAGDFVGLKNYTRVLTEPDFWNAARFTLIFTLVGVFGSWLVGLALALLLKTRIPGKGVFKVLLLLPWVVPVVVTATSWNWLVATPQSPLPILARVLGLGNVLFLADPLLAQVTVCVFKVWISFPFMIFCVNDFPTIFLLTGGGPVNATQSLVVLAYTTVFQNFQTGPGVAIAFLMTLVLIVISVVLYRQIKKVQIL
jgi:multiple sugar transport system permease protein